MRAARVVVLVGLGAAGATPLTGPSAAAAPAARRPPNVLVLLADDLRADALGAYGNRHARTPVLDRLARAGTSFDRAYIMGGDRPAVCTPSRAMLLTGWNLFRLAGGIPADAALLPEVFRKAGYVTYGVGKWHNERAAFTRAFAGGAAIFFGGMSDQTKVRVFDYDPEGRYAEGRARIGERFSTELFADAAVRFLESRADRPEPFFLYVAFTSPHDPRTPPERFARMYDPAKLPLPLNFLARHPFDNGEMEVRDEKLAPTPRAPEVVRRHIADYLGMVSHLDAEIGRILEALDRTGRARDTIVVFASDNGLALGSHGLLGKQNLYEPSVRVPLVLRGPGVPAGRRAAAFAYLLDLAPTLGALAGVPMPAGLDGQDLAPALASRPAASPRRSLFFAYRGVQRAVRDDRFKLIEYAVGGTSRTQLFDLRADPHETRDLAAIAAHRGTRERLAAELADWRRRLGDPTAAAPGATSASP